MSDEKRLDLGIYTAYAEAVEAGYTGTEEEFADGLARSADYANNAAASAEAAAASEANAEAWATGASEEEDEPSSTNNAKYYSGQASASAEAAAQSEANAEAWATGGSSGTPSATNNSKYYSEQAAESATEAASSAAAGIAALANEAPTFDATVAYAAGSYVIHNSTLYRFTAAHASGAWTGTDATAVKLGPELSDVKSAIDKIAIKTDITPTWNQGYIASSSGRIGSDNASCYSSLITSYGNPFKLVVAVGYKLKVAEYQANGDTFIGIAVALQTGSAVFSVDSGHKIRIQITKDTGTFAPADCTSDVYSLVEVVYADTTLTLIGKAADAKAVGEEFELVNDIVSETDYAYNLTWTEGAFISTANAIVQNANYAYTADYYRVFPGQKLKCNIYATGPSDAAAVFYDINKTKIGYAYSSGYDITVPQDAVFARFSNKITEIPTEKAYVRHDEKQIDNSSYFISNTSADATGQTAIPYAVDEKIIDWKYKGNVNRQKRYMAIGFDDLRASDQNMIMPLFEKYRAKATFNKVFQRTATNQPDILSIKRVETGNHELGDHTFLHYSFPYFDPLFNGQDPSSPDGSQVAFPSNNDFRADAGDGKNVFGKTLTDNVNIGGISGVTWANLTDEQCQTIREYYSVFKRDSIITILDTLSNRYLGTTGSSVGSWDTDHYTGGIFTGCATSANYEVWERILACVQCYTKSQCEHNMNFVTWSKPGAVETGLTVTYDGLSYYDPAHQYRRSPQTRFTSSLTGESRSWTDVLRAFGYKTTHDYPTRNSSVYASKQFFFNAWQAKKDAILYPTSYTVSYSTIANEYPSTFFSGTDSKEEQMYDVSGSFRNIITDLRHETANGMIHGEMIDSQDTYSERSFFEGVLRYCESAGIEVVTKAEAYDICFNNKLDDGNLIGNTDLINSAAVFMPDASYVETNPDGYIGSCSVTHDDNGIPVLVTSGKTTFLVYGVPYGKIKYAAEVKGTGTIGFYAVKNNSNTGSGIDTFTQLGQITVSSADSYTEYSEIFTVPKAELDESDILDYEGYGNRIVALGIVYSSGLNVKNIGAYKV